MNSERCKRALVISTLFKMIEYARWTPHSDWILFFALNYITDERPKWKPIAIEFQNEHKPHFSQFIFSHCYFQVENVENMYIDSCIRFEIHGLKFPLLLHAGRANANTFYRCLVDFERKINSVGSKAVAVSSVVSVVCACLSEWVCGLNFSETHSKLDF